MTWIPWTGLTVLLVGNLSVLILTHQPTVFVKAGYEAGRYHQRSMDATRARAQRDAFDVAIVERYAECLRYRTVKVSIMEVTPGPWQACMAPIQEYALAADLARRLVRAIEEGENLSLETIFDRKPIDGLFRGDPHAG